MIKYFGYISEEFVKDHSAITFTFDFSTFKCHSISGDEWFAEFDLQVKDSASGEGEFYMRQYGTDNTWTSWYKFTGTAV